MEAVKYNYGTTPEEVIRERIITVADTMGPRDDAWCWVGIGQDNLLTVLRSLKDTTKLSDGGRYVLGNPAPYFLRIQILAALGIDES